MDDVPQQVLNVQNYTNLTEISKDSHHSFGLWSIMDISKRNFNMTDRHNMRSY